MATRTNTFAHAISGVLARRAEMVQELGTLREQLAALSNDIETVDRTLEALGYQGEIKLTPHAARIVLFYKNELRGYCQDLLAEKGPLTTRQIGSSLIQAEGKDRYDRRMLSDVVRRVSRCLRQMRQSGMVTSEKVRGDFVWRIKTDGLYRGAEKPTF